MTMGKVGPTDDAWIATDTPDNASEKQSRRSRGQVSIFTNFSSGAREQENLAPRTLKNQTKDVAKLIVIVLPQIVALVVVSTLVLTGAVSVWDNSAKLKQHVYQMQPINYLISDFQRERSMTCIILSSIGLNQKELLENLTDARFHTGEALHKIEVWLGLPEDGIEMETKRGLDIALFHHRNRVDRNEIGCLENIIWFTNKIDILLAQQRRIFQKSQDGDLWNLIASKTTLLKAKDLIGVSGGADYLFNSSIMSYPKSGKRYRALTARNGSLHLLPDLKEMETLIEENKNTSVGSVQTGLHWYEDGNEYMDIIERIEDATSHDLIGKIENRMSKSERTFYITLIVVILAAIICPPTMAWYTLETRRMQKKVRQFTDKLISNAKELKQEKQKTDMILYQMLPVSIANELKQSRPVAPEHFEKVTLYFSDIKGFTALSGKSTPIQIIALLNNLYTSCDEILDKYDVYKVETIGDGYMVVSGLPKVNGVDHSKEICTMALHVMQMIDKFEIPHLPGQYLLMRIGIHTGSCAAGIVGTKMPRYCLFGDTVNTASRMESGGLAMRIQLSSATKSHLSAHFPQFKVTPRGELCVKGKGEMATFWLLGKEGFSYKINLNKAAAKVEAVTYWKTDLDVEEVQDD